MPVPSPWPTSFSATPERISLAVAAPGLARDRIADVWFFPAQWGPIEHAAPQEVAVRDDGLTLRLARGPLPDALAGALDGVLVITERLEGRTASHAFTVKAVPSGPAAIDPGQGNPLSAPAAGPRSISLLQAVALALAGGIVLNLMPCVLPVLSVKALALVEHAGTDAPRLRRHGAAYTAGVLACFGVVAGALLALRAGGEQIGWGFQLQSPLFVTLLAYVLFALALSLSGVVVIGGRLAGAGHSLASRPGYAGSFFTGALATVAATPCTAPFMGAAIGLRRHAALDDGATRLPGARPGPGAALSRADLRARPGIASCRGPARGWSASSSSSPFPLYASVAWLVWVVSQQVGPQGVAVALGGLLLIGFAAWLYEASRGARPRWRRAAVATVGLAVVGAVGLGAVPEGCHSPRRGRRGEPRGECRPRRSVRAGSPSCARGAPLSS